MDNHPIPQDVTGFQFRLIGDMTIKQFAYLAAGVVLAWICLSLPLFVLIKFPLVVLFGGLGIILAFIPLGGRPADTMLVYFFKAVFSPTTYQYATLSASTTMQPLPQEKQKDKKEEKVVLSNPVTSSFSDLFGQQDVSQVDRPALQPLTPLPEEPEKQIQEEKESTLEKEADAISLALQEAQAEEQKEKGSTQEQEAHQKVANLEKQLQEIFAQKQLLEEQLLKLQQQLAQKAPEPVFNPSVATAPKVTEHVKKVPPALSKTIGTPFVSDVPNLISGIVKDPRGNVLPNILIEVKDKDGNPVRAFKTNPLGQFASATPVMNGVYTLTFEDPNGKQRFDSVEIQAIGEVIEPLEVISVDAREDLRKELFGG